MTCPHRACFLVICFLFSGLAASAELVHRYTFENGAADSIGSQDGSFIGNAAVVSGSAPQGSQVLTLDGSGDGVNLGSLSFNAQFSITMWSYLPTDSYNFQTLIANSASGSSTAGFRTFINYWGSSNKQVILESGGSGAASASTPVDAVAYGQWNQVCFTVDTVTRECNIYVNGDLAGSGAVVENLPLNQTTYLGMCADGWYYKGQIDDVCIYDTVLTSGEVAQAYSNLVIPEPATGALISVVAVFGLIIRRRFTD